MVSWIGSSDFSFSLEIQMQWLRDCLHSHSPGPHPLTTESSHHSDALAAVNKVDIEQQLCLVLSQLFCGLWELHCLSSHDSKSCHPLPDPPPVFNNALSTFCLELLLWMSGQLWCPIVSWDKNSGPSNEHAIDGHVSPPSYVPESTEYLQGTFSTSEMHYKVSSYHGPFNNSIEKGPIPPPSQYTPVLTHNKADESTARNAQPCLVSNSSASFLFPPLYLIQISHIPTHHPPILLLQGLLSCPKAPILIQ